MEEDGRRWKKMEEDGRRWKKMEVKKRSGKEGKSYAMNISLSVRNGFL